MAPFRGLPHTTGYAGGDNCGSRAMGASGLTRALRRARAQVLEILRADLTERAESVLAQGGGLEGVFAEVAERRLDPYTAADRIAAAVAG